MGLCSFQEMVMFSHMLLNYHNNFQNISVHCPVGSITVNGTCNIMTDARNMLSMEEQQEHCNQMGMTLFSAKSDKEFNASLDLLWSAFKSYYQFQPIQEFSILIDYFVNLHRPFIYLPDGHAMLDNEIFDYKSVLTNLSGKTQVTVRQENEEYKLEFFNKANYRGQLVTCQKQPYRYCIGNFTSLEMQEKQIYWSYDCIQECLNQNISVSLTSDLQRYIFTL